MAIWTDFLLDSAPILSVFGPKPPTLDCIDLHELVLHRDGPRVVLRFDLIDFPTNPPKKWVGLGCNRLQIRLMALDVQSLRVAGLQSSMKINLKIERVGDMMDLSADNGSVQFCIKAGSLVVESISAYRDDSGDERS